jgi:DNA-binding HxlR family transcriptional regulator
MNGPTSDEPVTRRQASPTDLAGVVTLTGRFADRDQWTAEGWCSLERALKLIGTRSAMILIREAFYGGRRFEDLARRTGLSDAIAAKRLKQLVEDGLMIRHPYQVPGARTRHEYVLTSRGRALFPVLVSLIRWGDGLTTWRGAIELTHADCGAPVDSVVECAAGHRVPLGQTEAALDRRLAPPPSQSQKARAPRRTASAEPN